MGSYISIHNNTNDTYQVKVGPDEAAIQIATIAVSVVAAVATVVATAGAAAPLTATLVANGVVEVCFMSTEALAAFTGLAASVSGISIATSWASSTVLLIIDKLQKEEGYTEIKPGERKQFGKYTLSLWRQATCMRVRVNPRNAEEVIMDTVFMRPIFSGATAESTCEHSIQYWINKWGHEGEVIVKLSEETKKVIAMNPPQLDEE